MRQLSAILLIGLFAFSQYARQLSYLECKFSNSFKTSALKCDCEKRSGIVKQDKGQPLAATHAHFHPDEFFSATRGTGVESPLFFISSPTLCLPPAGELEGIYPEPWQPPNT